MIRMQLEELVGEVPREKAPSSTTTTGGRRGRAREGLQALTELAYKELLEPELLAGARLRGHDEPARPLRQPRGFRVLSHIPRLPDSVIRHVVERVGRPRGDRPGVPAGPGGGRRGRRRSGPGDQGGPPAPPGAQPGRPLPPVIGRSPQRARSRVLPKTALEMLRFSNCRRRSTNAPGFLADEAFQNGEDSACSRSARRSSTPITGPGTVVKKECARCWVRSATT